MNTPAKPAGRSALSRSGGLLLLGAALLLMLAGLFVFDRTRTAHAKVTRELVDAESGLAAARGREQLAQQNRLLLSAAKLLQQHAEASAVLSPYWGERQINLRQQSMTREQTNQLLLGTSRRSGQLLRAEEFEISVTHADEGLFETPPTSRLPLQVSLRGTTRFRLSER